MTLLVVPTRNKISIPLMTCVSAVNLFRETSLKRLFLSVDDWPCSVCEFYLC